MGVGKCGADVTELECVPYGVSYLDGGTSLLVKMGPHRILLDCGPTNLEVLRQQPDPPVDLVLCTHAHSDHARGLLEFHHAFPKVPIYASEVTTQLLHLNWPSLHPSEVPTFCQALPWRSPVEFRDGLSAELWPAGHLPGAAAILLTYASPPYSEGAGRHYTIFYTGDFFLSSSRLVDGFPLDEVRGLKPDVLIVEGSYGTARQPHRRQQENQLAERIDQAIASRYSILMPVPPLGLGQELLMLLRSHHHFTGREIDIWVSGTVAQACDAYLDILPHLPSSVQNFARHQPLFWDERIRPRMRRWSSSQALQSVRDGAAPCIMLVDETVDLTPYTADDAGNWAILIPEHPGYSTPSSAIQQFLQGQAPDTAQKLQAALRQGRIKIQTYLLSEHCDGPGTTQLIHNLRPQHVVFVHGSPTYLADLTGLDELNHRYQLHSPSLGIPLELPIGETFLQPAVPETTYEGELTELETAVTITLPHALISDPRWQNFADTGLVDVRWQGEELVLRGISQRELLSQGGDRPLPSDLECCGNCYHYRGRRCWNQKSPLFGFKVTTEGYCPVFEWGMLSPDREIASLEELDEPD